MKHKIEIVFEDLTEDEFSSVYDNILKEFAKIKGNAFMSGGKLEKIVCETCGEVEVEEQGDWCDMCLGIE